MYFIVLANRLTIMFIDEWEEEDYEIAIKVRAKDEHKITFGHQCPFYPYKTSRCTSGLTKVEFKRDIVIRW